MSYIVYDDKPGVFQGNMKLDQVNPHKFYLRHYDNLLLLTFMAQRGTKPEAYQARKELIICERKLKFWSRHPLFQIANIAKELNDLKARWNSQR